MADEIEAARARMIAKRFGGAENVRTGGKGSVRRKRKAQHKASSTGARGGCKSAQCAARIDVQCPPLTRIHTSHRTLATPAPQPTTRR